MPPSISASSDSSLSWAHTFNLGAAGLAVATVLASRSAFTRSLCPASIALLSHPVVAAGLLWTGFSAWQSSEKEPAPLSNFLSGAFLFMESMAFGLAAYRFGSRFKQDFISGFTFMETFKRAYAHADATRRVMMDPDIWVHFARGREPDRLNGEFRMSLVLCSLIGQTIALYAIPAYGVTTSLRDFAFPDESAPKSFSERLVSCATSLVLGFSPLATILLYRAGRGSAWYGLGPAMSHQLQSADYVNADLVARTLERLNHAVPRLKREGPGGERQYLAGARSSVPNSWEQLGNLARQESLAAAPNQGSRELGWAWKEMGGGESVLCRRSCGAAGCLCFGAEMHEFKFHRRGADFVSQWRRVSGGCVSFHHLAAGNS